MKGYEKYDKDIIHLPWQEVLIGGDSFRNQGVGEWDDKFCNYFTTFKKL